jgi:Mg-chelatase subunit ChlD
MLQLLQATCREGTQEQGDGNRILEEMSGYLDVTISFLLTDGQSTDSSNTQILERVRALNKDRHIAIYTIDFGNDADFLRRLATENGAKYVDQTHAGQLFPF